MAERDWLDIEHPVYAARKEQWERDEQRMLGLPDVANELRNFDWEDENGPQHRRRRESATYLNFPAEVAGVIVGHAFANAPAPDAGLDFGQLGTVRRAADIRGLPSEAELLYYNTDGIGNDGSQWDNFWEQAGVRACATGHRWILGDAPKERPLNRQEEINGKRPYLIELSPLSVTNWHFSQGTLMFAVVRQYVRAPRISADGGMSGNVPAKNYLVLVRKGYAGLGAAYAGGGWWRYNADKDIDGVPSQYDATDGEIPLGVLYAMRSPKLQGSAPSMSKGLTTEMGNIAVAYMNLSSARDFDVWDAAKSITYLLGADANIHNTVAGQKTSGSQLISVPRLPGGEMVGIADSAQGAVPALVMQGALDNKLIEADRLALSQQSSGTPDASGASKRAGFMDLKAPKLRLFVSEMEACQNTMLRFVELLWGKKSPRAYTVWDRHFDLSAFDADIQAIFTLMETATAKSATLVAKSIEKSLRAKGIITDEATIKKISAEIAASMAAASLAEAGGGNPADDRVKEAESSGGSDAADKGAGERKSERLITLERDPQGRRQLRVQRTTTQG